MLEPTPGPRRPSGPPGGQLLWCYLPGVSSFFYEDSLSSWTPRDIKENLAPRCIPHIGEESSARLPRYRPRRASLARFGCLTSWPLSL